MKYWAGWIMSWNQDCWQEYQQPQICRWHHPYGREWRASSWWTWNKQESEKAGLKLNIQKTKIMVSSSITSCQIDEEKMETVTGFIFLGSQITVDDDCSHEIKRRLLFERKAMTKLDSVWKTGNITLPTKVHIIKAMVFKVVMYRCENWTIKKAER